jgi:ribosomal protein S15P/S13E
VEENTARNLIEAIETLTTHIEDLRDQISTLGLQIENVLTPAVNELSTSLDRS